MRRSSSVLVGFLIMLACLPAGSAALAQTIGWQTVSTGRYPDATPPLAWSAEQNIVWKIRMPGPGYASPVLLADRQFVMSEPAELICIRNSDGEILWQRTHTYRELFGDEKAAKIAAELDAHQQSVISIKRMVQQLNQQVRTLEKSEPRPEQEIAALKSRIETLWKQLKQLPRPKFSRTPQYNRNLDAGNAACTPVTDGTMVYSVFATGVVSAHTIDGERKWMRHLETPTLKYGHAASPVLVENRLIVHLVDLVALDAVTGDEVWRLKHSPLHCTPLATQVGDMEVLLAADGTVVRAVDGKVVATRLYGANVATPVINNGIVYAQQRGKIIAFRLRLTDDGNVEAERLWGGERNGSGFSQIPTPVCHAGLIYGLNSAGILDVTDIETGERVYRRRLTVGGTRGSYNYYPSPVVAGGYLFLGANNGNTVVLRTGQDYHEVRVNSLERYTSTPVFAGTKMYLRGEENLYCISE